jgi:hypothetical protein
MKVPRGEHIRRLPSRSAVNFSGDTVNLRNVICACLIISMPLPAAAEAVALQEAGNAELTLVLNNLTVIAPPKENGWIVASLYSVTAFGECDGTPESCPKTTVYVAVSELEAEYPEQRLYLLPPSHGWKFVGWDSEQSASSVSELLAFTMEREVPAADLTAGWWTSERVKVRVSLDSATMDTLP